MVSVQVDYTSVSTSCWQRTLSVHKMVFRGSNSSSAHESSIQYHYRSSPHILNALHWILKELVYCSKALDCAAS
jgi:hypothetical protein